MHNFYLSESHWWSVVFPLEDLVEMQESRIRWSECKTGFCCAADSRRRLKLCLYGNRFTPNGKVELLVQAGLVWDLYQALTHAYYYKITVFSLFFFFLSKQEFISVEVNHNGVIYWWHHCLWEMAKAHVPVSSAVMSLSSVDSLSVIPALMLRISLFPFRISRVSFLRC